MAPTGGRRRPGGQGGYSFVEMMIAMAVAVIIGVGIYGILAYQRRAAESQRIVNDLQTGCRFAMDQIRRELSLAGYRAQDTVRPLKVADPNALAFEYWDERASFEAPFDPAATVTTPGYSRHSLVSYRVAGGDLVRTVRRWYQGTSGPTSYYMPGSSDTSDSAVRADFAAITSPVYRQTLATNVASFALQYFTQNNEPWNRDPDGNTATAPPFEEIRSVVASLQCRSADPDPNFRNPALGAAAAERYPMIRLQSEIRLRNVDIATNPRDTKEPNPPANLRVWDPGTCDQLALAWDANIESDLAGYTIYYGLAAGSYSNRVRLARSPGAAGERVSYTLSGLQASTTDCAAGTVAPVTHFIRVEAFDKSGNPSDRTAEVSGNPSPSITAESNAGNDTTINPAVPAAPAGFLASTPADNQIQLSWSASPVVGLVGYRLYRGSVAGFTPAGRRVGDPGSNIIADETTLNASALTYLDSGLTGCVPVHYKLAAIACDACMPIATQTFATISGSPTDGAKPNAPRLVARAGYRRVILSIENPVLASEPDFKETRVYFNAGAGTCTYPYFDAGDVLQNGGLLPDRGGVFTGGGTLASVNFDDENYEISPTGQPNLNVGSSYCFLAVAYDRCDNHSDATDSATDVGQQCGDCMTKDDPPQPDYACYGAPPAPANLATAGCYGSLNLAWDHADPDTIRDFTGYRVYRCEETGGAPCSMTSTLWSDPQWKLLTGDEPVWFSSFVDSPDKGLEEGRKYSYRVLATDCYWEQHHEKDASSWPGPANDPADNAAESSPPRPLSTGRVLLDTSAPVLSGMEPDAAWTTYGISTAFRHDTVLFRLLNTADAALVLKQAVVDWENSSAFLQRIALGDDSTTPLVSAAWLDSALPLTGASGRAFSFVPDAVYLAALDGAIPAHLTFKRSDGVTDDTVNLRENQMQVGISYRNDSTGDETCSMQEKLYVPLGPYISGTTQNLPHEGTVAAPVTGDSDPAMNSTLVPGNEWVDVHANVSDSDHAGIRSVRLYYYVDFAKTLGSAPPLASGADAAAGSLPPYTAIAMEPVAGTQWRTPAAGGIPASNDANVWYFIVAVDENGNFDREPEPDRGAFQYYQQPFDVCENVPGAPVLSWSATSSTVTLLWTAPLLNTDGTSCTDLGGYAVYRVAASGGPVKLAELGAGTLTWMDAPPNMSAETYTYYVTALDTCEQPGPNEGPASNWYTECEGASGCTVRLATTQQDATYFQAGDSFVAEFFACDKIDGVSGETVYVQVCSGSDASVVTLTESGDSGMFRSGTISTWLSEPLNAGVLDLLVQPSDTVAVHAWSATAPTGGCGSLTACSASLQVKTDPCTGIAAPATPALTVRVASGGCRKSDPDVNLSWTGTNPGAGLFYRVYKCWNANASPDCLPSGSPGNKVFPTGTEPDLAQTTRTAVNPAGVRPDQNHIRYQVEAVSHNGCSDRSLWQTAISPAVVDDCP